MEGTTSRLVRGHRGGRTRTDRLFEVLSNRRRRFALHYLRQHTSPVPLGELAEQVAAWENGTALHAVSCAERKRVYTALQQQHLPMMDEVGIVVFDKRTGIVELTADGERFDIYLEVVGRHDLPWSAYYGVLVAVCTLLVASARLGFPLLPLDGVGLATFLVVTFGVSVLVHHHYARSSRIGADGPPAEVGR